MMAVALSWLGARGIALIAGGAAVIALLVGTYQTGVNAERKRGEAASLRAEVAALQADRDIARRAEGDAIARAEELDAAAKANQDKIDELEESLRGRPVVGALRSWPR